MRKPLRMAGFACTQQSSSTGEDAHSKNRERTGKRPAAHVSAGEVVAGLEEACQAACKPGSVPLFPQWKERGGHSSGTALARRLKRPTRTAARRRACPGEPERPSLFGLAPGGACRAPFLAVGAVGSYPTVSPLPDGAEAGSGGLISAALSLNRSPGPPGFPRRLASMEPGLSSPARLSPLDGSDRPAA